MSSQPLTAVPANVAVPFWQEPCQLVKPLGRTRMTPAFVAFSVLGSGECSIGLASGLGKGR